MKKRATVFIIILILIYISLCVLSLIIKAEEYTVTYRVTATTAVRFAAGEEYDSFYQLTAGEEVQGREAVDGWCEINCYGFKGFVLASALIDKNKGSYYGVCYVTGYNPYCSHCCGKSNGITASGKRAIIGETVAMAGLPFGTRIYIKGLGYYTVQDRGVGRGCVDVACGSHAECYKLTGRYEVYLV